MKSQDMQVIGLCRFSYPAIGGFQVEHETIEDRIAYLYAERRMEERFLLFETITLPCLRAQTDPNFDFVIVIGDQLPSRYRDRLFDLTADIPQIRIEAHDPQPQRQIMKQVLNAARRDPAQPCLQFRHDDDDAVSLDFIRQFRAAADETSGLHGRHRSVAYDWHKGHVLEIDRDGLLAKEIHRPLLAVALGMYVQGGDSLTLMNFGHERLNRFMPVVSYGTEPMWARTHNAFNDSRQKKNVRTIPVQRVPAKDEPTFRQAFGIDADLVRARYSGFETTFSR